MEKKLNLLVMDKRLFFNRPGAEADLEYWRSVAVWTVEEAAAISLGKDPRILNTENDDFKRYRRRSPFLQEFEHRCLQLSRAVEAQDLESPPRPSDLVAWMVKRKIPTDFLENVDYTIDSDWRRRCCEAERCLKECTARLENLRALVSEPKGKRLVSFLKLTLGMAVARYGHSPIGNKSKAMQIGGELEDLGLKIDEDTIRNILTEAKERLDWMLPGGLSGGKEPTRNPKSD